MGEMGKIKFFVDFDGTITKKDVVDMILERFADSAWRQIEQKWQSGEIGSRECLRRQIALVRADKKTFFEFLKTVQVDPGFPEFLKLTQRAEIPVAIASDGFREIIEAVLSTSLNGAKAFADAIPIFSNLLDWSGDRLEARFSAQTPCEHGCANCKVRVIDAHSTAGEQVIFVGDGLSDRFAAQRADHVFAKGALLNYCTKNNIMCERYSGFEDVCRWIEKMKGETLVVRKRTS